MPLIRVCGKRHTVTVTLTEQRCVVGMIITGSNKCRLTLLDNVIASVCVDS